MPDWQEADGSHPADSNHEDHNRNGQHDDASQKDQDQLIDNQLIEQAQAGDAEAFGDLYERHAPVIFRFIYSHVDNRSDAEDLTSEVFVRVWKSISNYKDQGAPFVAYLFRIARNAIIDFYRRSSRAKNSLPLEDTVIEDDRPDPSDVAITNLEHQEVRRMLEQLREEYQTVLTLRFLGNLSPDETAEVMGKSPGAVRVLQHRALNALRKMIGS